MYFKSVIFAALFIAVLVTSSRAEWGKKQIDQALERAEQMKQNIIVPKLSELLPVNEDGDCNCIKDEQEILPVTQTVDSEKLYLLISSSVPMPVLQTYARQMKNHKNTTMVLRGFVGGIQKIRPTLEFISRVRCNNSVNAAVEINPELFNQYGVTRVPAMIWQNGRESLQITGAIDLDEAVRRFKRAQNY